MPNKVRGKNNRNMGETFSENQWQDSQFHLNVLKTTGISVNKNDS